MSDKQLRSLDQFDLKLLAELESYPRQNYKQLAAKMGVSRPTITNKIRQLRDSGVIRNVCWVDPFVLGYQYNLALAISVQPKLIEEVANKLAANKRILLINLCFGRFNIVAWANFRTGEDISYFLVHELGSINGILQFETILLIQLVKISPMLLTDEPAAPHPDNIQIDLDDLDLELIKELQIDAGQSSSQLARKLGEYKSRIIRRIQRLTDKQVIRIVGSVNPLALGFEGVALICLKCDPLKISEVVNMIVPHRQIIYAGICTGRYDITMWVVFQKFSDLRSFISVELGNIPGVKDIETMMVYKLFNVSNRLPIV